MDAIQHVPNDTKPAEFSSYDINEHMMEDKDVETQMDALAAGQPQGEEDVGMEITDTATSHNSESIFHAVPSMEGVAAVNANIESRPVEEKEVQKMHENHLSDAPGLELPDNIDNEDLSKLLELDTKQGGDIFDANEILEHAMRGDQEVSSGSETGEDEKDKNENGKDEDNDGDDHDDDDDDDNDDNDDDDDDDDDDEESEDRNDNSSAGNEGSQQIIEAPGREERLSGSDPIEKDATLSPRMAASDAEDVRTSSVAIMAGESTGSPLQAQRLFKHEDEHSPAAILQEKGELMTRKRHNSLTPVMFQQHEILMSQMHGQNVMDENGVGGQEGENSMSLSDEQPTISAYARLDFQSFTFYVQTLHVIIGRRSENDFSHKVDVNLGPSKSISRRHAQIFYNFGTGRFELSIIGKNGAFVDDIFVERGNTVPLKNKTKIQVGQIPFQFVLPDQEKGEQPQKSPEPPLSAGPEELDSKVKEENESKKLLEEIKTASPVVSDTNITLENDPAIAAAHAEITCPKPIPTKPTLPPQAQPRSQPSTVKRERERRPPKIPKKVYSLEEIPPEFRTKPTCSYSALLTECIRKYSSPKGMSLSEIYAGIRELFPYYKYCPDGWQSSVRHNLSLNKSFRKVSKEGKGWLWGLDEDYIAERERQKKKQAEVAAAKAAAAQERLELQQQQRARKAASGASNSSGRYDGKSNGRQQSISQTLAANRATDKKSGMNDHQRTMKYLQEQLIILTKNRKGLPNQTIASILTQALAMTINQVTQAAKNKGISGNPLTALMDKNPQHLNLILAAAVNAATSKATNGKVKQLVNMPSSGTSNAQIKTQTPSSQVSKPSYSAATDSSKTNTSTKGTSSFDPTSLSRFFQPRQPTKVSAPVSSVSKPTIPQKRTHEQNGEESSTSEDSPDSEEEENTDEGNKGAGKDGGRGDDDDDDDDDDEDEDEDDDDSNSSTSSGEEDDNHDDGKEQKKSPGEATNKGEEVSNVLDAGSNTDINDN